MNFKKQDIQPSLQTFPGINYAHEGQTENMRENILITINLIFPSRLST